MVQEDLSFHLKVVPLSLDPQRMEDMYSMFIALQVYRGLLRYLPDGSVQPDLAESWQESNDRRTYTFKLRPMKFSDGTPIRAENVVWSFARMFKIKSDMANDLQYFGGVKEFLRSNDIRTFGVRALSDQIVEFQLRSPSALFLKHLATVDCAILPLSKTRTELSDDLPFSGPYALQKKTNEEWNLIRWRDDLLDSQRPPKKLHFFSSQESAYQLALHHKTDSLANDQLVASETNDLQRMGWRPIVGSLARERFVILDPKIIEMKIRRALYQSFHPEQMIATLNLKLHPAFGFIPFSLPGYLDQKDIEPLRVPIPPLKIKSFPLELEFDGDDFVDRQIANYLKSEWERIGVLVSLHPFSTPEYLTRLFAGKAEAILGRKGMDYPDGFSVLGYFRASGEESYFKISNANLNQSIDRAAMEFDDSKRLNAYRDIQKQILRFFTVIPVCFGSNEVGLWSPRIASVPPHPMGFHTIPLEMVELKN